MDVSEDESVGSYKVEPPKGPSIASSSRQRNIPISLTPDECNGKNMEDLLNTFLGMGENEVDSNSNLDERNDQIAAPARENDENANSEGSEAAAPAAGNGRRRAPTFEEIATLLAKRKRRMIKNRESAQRSRARKLAYIAGLEAQVDRLRDNNEMLKLIMTQILTTSQEEEVEKNKETTKAQCVANKLKKLRRVSSVTW